MTDTFLWTKYMITTFQVIQQQYPLGANAALLDTFLATGLWTDAITTMTARGWTTSTVVGGVLTYFSTPAGSQAFFLFSQL